MARSTSDKERSELGNDLAVRVAARQTRVFGLESLQLCDHNCHTVQSHPVSLMQCNATETEPWKQGTSMASTLRANMIFFCVACARP